MTDPNEIVGPLAEMTVRVACEGYRPSWTPPRPTHFAWAGLDVDLSDAEIHLDDNGCLTLMIKGGPGAHRGFHQRMGRLNEPATIRLDDGTDITTPHAHLARSGTSIRTDGPSFFTVEIEFNYWE